MIYFMTAAPSVGTRIKKRRQVLRLTQQDLATKLGVSKSTVANWERGKHFPLRYLGAVEAALDISLEDEAAAGPLADLEPLDEWESGVAADRYLPDEDKRWFIEESRRARRAYEDARSRREGEAGGPSGGRSSAG